ncbi:manganese/zinc/iron transport system permease protein [Mameliella alba]|uniref:metal ABC transporter permease n=1 Tax=Mameliella TaxID=1434019 RepID=UPI00088604A1|nr:metal ABC transporter permease [Mameliella alba]MCR9274291.1 metal ABC transporter permease [Paracoccaceae bacterium]OWV43589.1 metal ABC transporter permease [Mameliella alba]OWV54511.1 metal ABC transporter permease [Mameliella alba]PTR36226.1 manganese/zinc/iron transport system permease protein [Mameliella alba]SDE00991.1 manganese/zinc/iron transport system permease protein [Mameliella alba]
MTPLIEALLLQAGYNAALVAVGAALLGFAAGAAGTFLFLRKRALVSDAVAHATLPGVGLAFIAMVWLGGDGRNLLGLLAGSAVTAGIGLLAVEWMTRRTRLSEDAAIGAVLSVFFGLGIVILTVIQTMSSGRQAGLESFLLGSTAGMLFQDAIVIAVGGSLAVLATWVMRRPMTLVAFDAEYAAASGVNVPGIDRLMMALVMAVTVIGLKIVGLILIVAMLIIPPVTARFWTERSQSLIWYAGGIGAVSGYLGAALSASAPDLPTGPIIVLVAAGLFLLSLFLAPARGVAAAVFRHRRFQRKVHRRQGLLALARQEPIHDELTLRVLRGEGLIRADGVATETGRAQAAKIARDERRWDVAREIHQDTGLTGRYDGLTPIEDVFAPDEIAEFDSRIGGPRAIGEGL